MAGRAGIRIFLTADTKGLNKGLSHAQSSVDKFAKGAGKLGSLGGGGLAGIVGGLTSLGGAAAFLKDSVHATNDLYLASKRLSTITGMDLHTSSEWVSLAKARGIEADTLGRSYKTLAGQVGLAQRGGKTANETFKQLGVSQQMLKRGNTQEILGQISDGLSKHADGLGKTRVAAQLFGRNYMGMLKILNGGKKNLNALLTDEAKHGAVLSNNDKELKKARESQLKFNQAMEKLKVTVGLAVLPYITKLSDKMTKWLSNATNRRQINDMVKSFAGIAKQAGQVVSFLVPIVSGIGKFAGKHPAIAKIVADMIALRLAIKMISFASPLRGLGTFAYRMHKLPETATRVGTRIDANMAAGITKNTRMNRAMSKLSLGLGRAGKSGGAKFAVGFLAMLGPVYSAVNDLVAGATKGDNSKLGRGLFQVGGMILGGAIGSIVPGAGTVAGAAIVGIGSGFVYDALGLGGKDKGKKAARQIFRVVWTDHGRKMHRDFGDRNSADAFKQTLAINAVGSLPSFGVDSATPSQNSSPAKKKAGKTTAKVTPAQALHRAMKLRHWYHPTEVRLSKISVNDHTLAADRRRKTILEQGVAKWKSVRSELKQLAGDAHRGGDAEISGRIWDLIHTGDGKVAGWKLKLGVVKDAIAVESSQEAIDNANRKLQVNQDTLKSEDAFLRTAFGFGDIGTGGMNAFLAGGGVATQGNSRAGGNVQITINSLHPGDAKTKQNIASAVATAFSGQGSRLSSSAKVGG